VEEVAEQQYNCFERQRTQNVCTVNTLSDFFQVTNLMHTFFIL